MLKVVETISRQVKSLDGLWDFQADTAEVGTAEKWFSAPLPASQKMPVPASFNEVTIDPKLREHVGDVWYQTEAFVPAAWEGQRVVLRFDSATHRATVYVNDQPVMEHEGGYLPFEADITDRLEFGAANRITARVDNRLTWQSVPPGQVVTSRTGETKQTYFHDFFNYAGLHRSVKLYTRPAIHVQDVTITTDIKDGDGLVNYAVDCSEETAVRVQVLDAAGTVVASQEGASGEITVPHAHLWAPGHGYLYTLEVTAGDDSYRQRFGIRTVQLRGSELLINGEPFYFRGYGRHEDNIIRGKGHDNVMMVHDFELMKWQGANSFRTSHYPYAEEVLDYADEQGFVVIDETAAVGMCTSISGGIFGSGNPPATFSEDTINDATAAVHAQHIRELVARDKNHPCVVIWSIANEPESWTEESATYFAPLAELTRELDSTRPVGYVNMQFGNPDVEKCMGLFDVIMLNRYYSWYFETGDIAAGEAALREELDKWTTRYDKPIIFTEYGPDTMPGNHDWYSQPWSEEFQVDMLGMYHRVFDDYPAVIGEQMWNFADFMTTSGIMRVSGNKKGMFTRDRLPKKAAHEVRKRWLAKREELGF